jgi:hypothetical protein
VRQHVFAKPLQRRHHFVVGHATEVHLEQHVGQPESLFDILDSLHTALRGAEDETIAAVHDLVVQLVKDRAQAFAVGFVVG